MRSLRLGVWHLPYTSTPDKGGNTVLVGHRFTYAGPAVFYHLDKVQVGDDVTMQWQNKTYTYTVTEVKVVPPTETSVEANTKDPQLTIYTCTPLWTAKNRLVIVAKPVGAAQ
jgi:sortase A